MIIDLKHREREPTKEEKIQFADAMIRSLKGEKVNEDIRVPPEFAEELLAFVKLTNIKKELEKRAQRRE